MFECDIFNSQILQQAYEYTQEPCDNEKASIYMVRGRQLSPNEPSPLFVF
jgi:hypothetical protein